MYTKLLNDEEDYNTIVNKLKRNTEPDELYIVSSSDSDIVSSSRKKSRVKHTGKKTRNCCPFLKNSIFFLKMSVFNQIG